MSLTIVLSIYEMGAQTEDIYTTNSLNSRVSTILKDISSTLPC